ncbi:2-oxoglutarate dehydrogenase, E2 component, dihydrolipoamide succinyltransferase [Babesia caballi]|uniref:2-oxoglutarate dehydrogenase, E2 component, dihydrolipoamide succinyltransferase n=1 Tax=Babesia caballi TaxID=5871 RepID=A0AAV4M0R9_BABCB|nr:2-oxoglutarate dehydrogenase, E2 component, dihydrolipoamide succinyltransferase [Babesia caballi]
MVHRLEPSLPGGVVVPKPVHEDPFAADAVIQHGVVDFDEPELELDLGGRVPGVELQVLYYRLRVVVVLDIEFVAVDVVAVEVVEEFQPDAGGGQHAHIRRNQLHVVKPLVGYTVVASFPRLVLAALGRPLAVYRRANLSDIREGAERGADVILVVVVLAVRCGLVLDATAVHHLGDLVPVAEPELAYAFQQQELRVRSPFSKELERVWCDWDVFVVTVVVAALSAPASAGDAEVKVNALYAPDAERAQRQRPLTGVTVKVDGERPRVEFVIAGFGVDGPHAILFGVPDVQLHISPGNLRDHRSGHGRFIFVHLAVVGVDSGTNATRLVGGGRLHRRHLDDDLLSAIYGGVVCQCAFTAEDITVDFLIPNGQGRTGCFYTD